MPATYKDIQKMTGLSLSTISKYFNGGNVREESRAAIEHATKALDYRVNPLASGLKSKQTKTVGILIPELTSTFHTTVMSRVIEQLREKGYGSIVCDASTSKANEKEALLFLLDKLVDGIIAIPYDKTGSYLHLAKERDVPVVLIDRIPTNFRADAVIIDNEGAGAKAAQHLLEYGHRDIGMVAGPGGVYTLGGRREGFARVLRQHGLRTRWMLESEFSIEGGYTTAKKLLAGGEAPTALFCANYELTLGTVIAMNELGLRYPDDISLIGFDNLLLSKVLKPTLTMVVQPMGDMADCAARLLLQRMGGKAPQGIQTVELAADLVEGASVRRVQP